MRIRFFAVLMTACVASGNAAMADARTDVLTAMARCAAIADNRKWLDCYYGAAQPMRALLGLPPAPEAQQRLSAGAMPSSPIASPDPGGGASFGLGAGSSDKVPPQQFGLNQPSATAVDHIAARMTAFTLDGAGFFTATLSNGQVWRQQSGDTSKVGWSKSAEKMAYNIVITHGVLGSYNFRVLGTPGFYKVERVR